MNPDKNRGMEVAARGEAIYAERIRSLLPPDAHGKFVVIDIETGDFEIADDDMTATKRMLERSPGENLYGLRVGYRAAYRMGARFKFIDG